jgi:D-glycero-alpha-D-manno-heptose-7-phosphate kinase
MTRDAVEILERSGDDDRALRDFGALLDEAWQVKQRLSRAISGDTTDRFYAEGKAIGAWGGKLLGAGGGGFMLFLVHPDHHRTFMERFRTAQPSLVRIEEEGSVAGSLRPRIDQ